MEAPPRLFSAVSQGCHLPSPQEAPDFRCPSSTPLLGERTLSFPWKSQPMLLQGSGRALTGSSQVEILSSLATGICLWTDTSEAGLVL